MSGLRVLTSDSGTQEAVRREKALQKLVTAFICTGLAYLLLPGLFSACGT